MRNYILPALLIFFSVQLYPQPYAANWESLDQRKAPEWFTNAKFGVFIHWGVYAVPSYVPVGPDGYSEWYWNNLTFPDRGLRYVKTNEFHERVYGKNFSYYDFAPLFKAEFFNADEWAALFKKSGIRYVVPTSKHHDGYCLWPSKEASKSYGRPWNALEVGPQRDLLMELSEAVKKEGLTFGVYYSLYEWFNPLWLTNRKAYVDEHMIPQFKDLVATYKPQVIFTDGEWDMNDTAWRSTEILSWLFNESPVRETVLVNDRWGKNTRTKHGSFYSSEYGAGMSPNVLWEESRGMGESYGYNRIEKLSDYKSARELLIILIDIVSRGGNLLLDIGPAADGLIPVIMQERLLQMGDWLGNNGEAIYNTRPNERTCQWSEGVMPQFAKTHYQSDYNINKLILPSSENAHIECFFTKNKNVLYCILPSFPEGKFLIKDLKTPEIESVSMIGYASNLNFKQTPEGVEVEMPEISLNKVMPTNIYTLKIVRK